MQHPLDIHLAKSRVTVHLRDLYCPWFDFSTLSAAQPFPLETAQPFPDGNFPSHSCWRHHTQHETLHNQAAVLAPCQVERNYSKRHSARAVSEQLFEDLLSNSTCIVSFDRVSLRLMECTCDRFWADPCSVSCKEKLLNQGCCAFEAPTTLCSTFSSACSCSSMQCSWQPMPWPTPAALGLTRSERCSHQYMGPTVPLCSH